MPEKELYRKAFSAIHLVETFVGSLLGGDGNEPKPPSSLTNPYSESDTPFLGM